ncbi:MAG: CARDB domain-containing protein [Planctomycetota bacterium]
MKTTQWSGLETLESRLMLSGVLDSVNEVFIEQGLSSWDGPGQEAWSFEIGLETVGTGAVDSARFRRGDEPDAWQPLTMELEDEGEEWFFEVEGPDTTVLDPYGDTSYIIEITPTTGDVQTITLDYLDPDTGVPLDQPLEVPQFTNLFPFATGVGTSMDFTWAPVTDPSVVSMELCVGAMGATPDDWMEVAEVVLPADATSSGAVDLTADTPYYAELLFDNARVGTTAEGVPFFITKYTETGVPFNTYTDLLTPITEVYILEGVETGPPSDPTEVSTFELGFTSDQAGWFQAASFRTPGGQIHPLMQHEDLGPDGHDWWFEIANTDPTALSDFTAGTYMLEVDFGDGLMAATPFDFVDPDTQEALSPPPDLPAFTAPTDQATNVPTDTTFTWDAPTDPAVAAVELDVEDLSTGTDLFEIELTPDVASYTPASPLATDAAYEAFLAFYAGQRDLTNTNGVPYSVAAYREGRIVFATGDTLPSDDPLTTIMGVRLDNGATVLPGGGTEYGFSLGMMLDRDDWLDTARFQIDGGTWYDLTPITIDDPMTGFAYGYHVGSPNEADLTAYAGSTLTLEFALPDTTTLSTSFALDGTATGPTQMPAFTAPLDGAVDVATDVTFAWEPVADAAVNSVSFEVIDPVDGMFVVGGDVPEGQSTWAQTQLMAGRTYEAELAFGNVSESSNTDGVPFMTTLFTSSEIQFATAGEPGPFDPIAGAFLEHETTALPDGTTEYAFEIGFFSAQSAWFDSAEFQYAGGAWTPMVAETYGDGYEWFFEDVSTTTDLTGQYGTGTYTVRLNFDDGTSATTDLVLDELPPAPAETPVFTTPVDGATDVATDVTFAWEAVTDPSVVAMWLEVEDSADDIEVLDVDLDPSSTSFAQSLLQEGRTYEAALEFGAGQPMTNTDGLTWHAGTFASQIIAFSTVEPVDPLTLIDDVYIENGAIDLPGGTTEWAFAFGMLSPETGWFDTALLHAPDAQTYTLQAELDEPPAAGYEWVVEVVGDTSEATSDLAGGTYTLELVMADQTSVTTDFFFDAAVPAPTQTPEWLTPTDGAVHVEPDTTLHWSSPAEANVAAQWLSVEDLADGTRVTDQFLDPTTASFSQAVLQANRSYEAELVFANGHQGVLNADGITYSQANYAGSIIQFTTAERFEPLSMIDEVFVDRGYIQTDTGAAFEFEMGFESAQTGWFDTARVQAPGGTWYTLTGGDLTDDGTAYEWFYEVASAESLDLADFTLGTYQLEFTSAAGQTATTAFAMPAEFVPPDEVPSFTSPVAGDGAVEADVTFAWSAPTDTAITGQVLEVVRAADGAWIIDEAFATDVTSFPQAMLETSTPYEATVAYVIDSGPVANTDGVTLIAEAYAARTITFQTQAPFDPLMMIGWVDVQRGSVLVGDEAEPDHCFAFMVDSAADGRLEGVEFQIDGAGTWYPLTAETFTAGEDSWTQWAYEVVTPTVDDLAAFTDGVYTLRLTYDQDQQVTTDLAITGLSAVPAGRPLFTSPVDGAVVSPDVTFAWAPAAGPDAMAVGLGVMDMDRGEGLFQIDLDPATTEHTPQALAFGTAYGARVGYLAGGGDQANDDGIAYSVMTFSGQEIAFATEAATVDLSPTILEVAGLADPALWGATGTVSVQVTNLGTDTAAGSITVDVFLSDDTVLDGADVLVGSSAATVDLAADTQQTEIVSVTIPNDVTDGAYHLIAHVAADASIVEDSVANNTDAAAPITVEQPLADLRVTLDDLSYGGRVLSGDTGTATVTLSNAGNTAAGGTKVVRLYTSTSATPDETMTEIGAVAYKLALAVDDSITLDVPVRIPPTAAANFYYLFAVADPGGVIPEQSEVNNVDVWPVPLSVEAPTVDLTGDVTDAGYTGEALPNDGGTASLTVTNLGNVGIRRDVVITAYLSTTPALGDDATEIGRRRVTLSLDADGGTADVTVATRLPADLAAGDYYLVAELDSRDAVDESNELNNLAVSAAPLTVVEPVIDLTGTILDTGFDASVVAGAAGIMRLQLLNQGNIPIGRTYVTVDVKLGTSLDPAAATLLRSMTFPLALAAETGTRDIDIPVAIPADLATGDYTLMAVLDTGEALDESSEINNVVYAGDTTHVEAQVLDLAATLDAVTLPDPLLPGARGTVQLSIFNQGNTALMRQRVDVAVYASAFGEVDENALPLGQAAAVMTLAPDAAGTTLQVNLTVPDDAAWQDYDLIAVIDTADAVAEGDETNNAIVDDAPITVVEPFTDLTCEITEVAFDGAVLPGDRGTVTVTVTNEGNINAVGPVTVTLQASDSQTPDGTGVELGQLGGRFVLTPGASRAMVFPVTVPDAVEQFEEVYFHAAVDGSDAIGENDTTNNTAVLGGPALADPIRDLTGEVLAFVMPDTLIAGDRSAARLLLTNSGNMPVVGSIDLGVYARNLDDPLADDIALGAPQAVNVNLQPGGGRQATIVPVEIPESLDAGTTYQLRVTVDDADVVEEPDESDNEVLLGGPRLFVQRFGTFDGHVNEALTLTDSAGRPVTFALVGGGYGTVDTDGEGRFEVTLSETTARSVARITPEAGRTTAIHTLTADADLGALLAETTDLTGSMTFAGGVGRIEMRHVADQHQITLGASTLATNFTLGNVTDLSIDTPNPINVLQVGQWIDTDGDDTIAAPAIGMLTSDGAFQANLEPTGVDAPRGLALGTVRIAGDVDDGDGTDTDWAVLSGSVGTVEIAGRTDTFALAGADARLLRLDNAGDASVTFTGDLGLLQAGQWTGGAIEAASVNALTVDGDFGASVTVAETLGNARIDGAVTAGAWSVGGLGLLSVTSATDWTLDLNGGDLRTLMLPTAVDTTVRAGDIGVLRTDTWLDGGIEAASLGTLLATGEFFGDLTLTGGGLALGAANIGGDLGAAVTAPDGPLGDPVVEVTWDIAGDVGAINVNGQVDNFTLTGGTLRSFTAGRVLSAALGTAAAPLGDVGVVRTADWLGGGIASDSVRLFLVDNDSAAGLTVGTGDAAVGVARIGGSILGGAWTVNGPVVSLTIGGAVADGSLDLGDADVRAIALGDATNTSITAGSLGIVRADTWLGGTLTAESIGAVTINGDFSAGFTLNEPDGIALGALTVRGDVTGGTWDVTGSVGVVRVNGTLAGGTWNVSDNVGLINATALGAADITAESFNAIIARTAMNGTRLTATQPVDAGATALGRLVVVGAIDGSTIRSTGSIGVVAAGAMTDSALFAGVRGDYDEPGGDGVQDLPTSREAFVNPGADVLAGLRSLTLRGLRGAEADQDALANTNIAAGTIGRALLRDVGYDNGATPFGVAVLDDTMRLVMRNGRQVGVWGRTTWPADTGDFGVTVLDGVAEAPEPIGRWFNRR